MRTRSTRAGVVGGLVAACLIGGAVYGAVQIAGATAPGTTFYACLAGGKLTKVATVAPTCVSPATQISWDSAGPQGTPGATGDPGTTGIQGIQGPVGPQGLSSAQYVGENAWAGANSGPSGAFPSIPAGKTLTITSVSGPYGVTCTISGTLNGNPYSVNWGGSTVGGANYWGAILPQNVGGLQWSFSSGTAVQGSCISGGAVSVSGYLS